MKTPVGIRMSAAPLRGILSEAWEELNWNSGLVSSGSSHILRQLQNLIFESLKPLIFFKSFLRDAKLLGLEGIRVEGPERLGPLWIVNLNPVTTRSPPSRIPWASWRTAAAARWPWLGRPAGRRAAARCWPPWSPCPPTGRRCSAAAATSWATPTAGTCRWTIPRSNAWGTSPTTRR